jgi:hypothetical protein
MVAQLSYQYIRRRPAKLVSRLLSYVFFEGRPLTTSGRWFNPAIFLLFSIEKRICPVKKIDRPIFIVGTGRSGTTILGVTLSMHKDVGFLNEPKALWHAIYPYEDIIGSYSRGAARYRLLASDATRVVRENAFRLYGIYSAVIGSCRIVDKYPELIFRLPFVLSIFPDAKFIFLARNGYATCKSIDSWSDRLGAVTGSECHDWWGVDRRKWNLLLDQIVTDHADLTSDVSTIREWRDQKHMAALEWIVTMREVLAVLQDYPDAVMQVKYEDLCEDPRRVLRDICKFANLEDDSVMEDLGINTLQPSDFTGHIKLPAEIEGAFNETMARLGYQ